jgi:hypothetical protein
MGWYYLKKKKFREELIAYFLYDTDCTENDAVLQFSYCSVCIRGRGNVFTEPLPSNDRGIYIQTHRLMTGIYEVSRSDGLRYHDIHKQVSQRLIQPFKS